ncbi:hypothetical protein SAMN05216474_0668 [Lishizhenia tianjinensis]|uniref:Tetratricopeptide repeat-containing protein n=1 Tax=Lishizhenia tianjinensis TaxID=477690 RepID=A0A1I6Y6A6_9FLAO|nr:hypothetical protein [Lishizhenia tianjinensis]SFT45684.1 hypothetical protein SAMN05216474_0668 [Lishizhenia tianjinensis]
MYKDLTKFNKLYTHLLSLNQGEKHCDYIKLYQDNFVFLGKKIEEEEVDSSIQRKRLVLLSNYADKLYQVEKYQEAESVTRQALFQFDNLTEKERDSTKLYQLMLFNLAKIAYKLNDVETSYKRFKRLYDLYPDKSEYLTWLLMLNHQKKKKVRYLLVVLVGVCLATAVLLMDKEQPIFMYGAVVLSVLCFIAILYFEIKFIQTKRILEKKASS